MRRPWIVVDLMHRLDYIYIYTLYGARIYIYVCSMVWAARNAWHLFASRRYRTISGRSSQTAKRGEVQIFANIHFNGRARIFHLTVVRWAPVVCHNNIFSVNQMTCASQFTGTRFSAHISDAKLFLRALRAERVECVETDDDNQWSDGDGQTERKEEKLF